jgi:conserved domain protein
MIRLLSFGFAFDIDYFRVSYFIQWYNLCDGATDLETDMNTAIKLDPLVYEFDSESEADTYSKWLENEIAQARRAPVISNEEATNRLDANRARLLEKLKNAR